MMITMPVSTEKMLRHVKMLVSSSGKSVYTTEQLARLLSITKPSAKNYIYLLVKNNLARRLQRGKITFSSDDLVNASQMIEPSYISVSSALYFHGMVMQVPAKVFCVTTVNTFDFEETGYYYHRIPSDLFFGFEKLAKADGTFFYVATKEKAVIDMVYLNLVSPGLLRDVKRYTSKKRMAELLDRYEGRGSKRMKEVLIR